MWYNVWSVAAFAGALAIGQDPAVKPPASCPVTKPANTFVPPSPHKLELQDGYFFVGTDRLWTWVPLSGVYVTVKGPDGYSTKQAWWTASYPRGDFEEWRTAPKPSLMITARRLDGDTPSPPPSHGSFSWVPNGPFFMSGPTVPTPGCWEITGALDGVRLSFVVWVGG